MILESLGGRVDVKGEFNVLDFTQHYIIEQLAQDRDALYVDLDQGVFLNVSSTQGLYLTWGMLDASMGCLIPHMGPVL